MRGTAREPGWHRAGSLLMMICLLMGCASWSAGDWGKQAKYVGFNPNSLNRGGAADFTILLPLSKIFYERVTARRFNSLATYEDPALRNSSVPRRLFRTITPPWPRLSPGRVSSTTGRPPFFWSR